MGSRSSKCAKPEGVAFDTYSFFLQTRQMTLDILATNSLLKELDETLYSIDTDIDCQMNDSSAAVLQSTTFRRHVSTTNNIMTNIFEKFEFGRMLGCGSSCKVHMVTDKVSQQTFALKELSKYDEWSAVLFRKEIKILSQLQHPNILRYHDVYIDQFCYYIGTEYCTGGALLGYHLLHKKKYICNKNLFIYHFCKHTVFQNKYLKKH